MDRGMLSEVDRRVMFMLHLPEEKRKEVLEKAPRDSANFEKVAEVVFTGGEVNVREYMKETLDMALRNMRDTRNDGPRGSDRPPPGPPVPRWGERPTGWRNESSAQGGWKNDREIGENRGSDWGNSYWKDARDERWGDAPQARASGPRPELRAPPPPAPPPPAPPAPIAATTQGGPRPSNPQARSGCVYCNKENHIKRDCPYLTEALRLGVVKLNENKWVVWGDSGEAVSFYPSMKVNVDKRVALQEARLGKKPEIGSSSNTTHIQMTKSPGGLSIREPQVSSIKFIETQPEEERPCLRVRTQVGTDTPESQGSVAEAGGVKKHKTVAEKVKPVAVSWDRTGEATISEEEIADIIRKRKETEGQGITADRLAKMDIGDGNLTEKEKEFIAMTLRGCDKAIAFDDSERGRIDPRYAKPARIHTVPHVPWKDRPQWKYAQKEEEIVAFIKEKIRTFVAEPCKSAYSNKWFFLRKGGSNKLRWIQNLQRTNAVTIRDVGSIPEADLLAEGSAGRSIYSICDLFFGYDEIPLDYRDRHMTPMHTLLGLVQRMVVPMGWTNGVAVFQRAMIVVLKEFILEKVEVFLDDFPIKEPVERDETEVFPGVRKFVANHMSDVRNVLEKLEGANLTVLPVEYFPRGWWEEITSKHAWLADRAWPSKPAQALLATMKSEILDAIKTLMGTEHYPNFFSMLGFSDLANLAASWDEGRDAFNAKLLALARDLEVRKIEYGRECVEFPARTANVERLFMKIWGLDHSHLQGQAVEKPQAECAVNGALAMEIDEMEEMRAAMIGAIAEITASASSTPPNAAPAHGTQFTAFAPLPSLHWVEHTGLGFKHQLWKLDTFNYLAPFSLNALVFLAGLTKEEVANCKANAMTVELPYCPPEKPFFKPTLLQFPILSALDHTKCEQTNPVMWQKNIRTAPEVDLKSLRKCWNVGHPYLRCQCATKRKDCGNGPI
ncbi:hypothetical protein CBR_g25772 [Chara braunii]|uniref:CCHC-type domain-containing protein n=1 Tax=Chara braunii TaxID=69332 RepID=A0A388L6H4_CHABU|nr:hypothetical protein CBR_g25772 [Chara braunii]|eukprot:GBG77842.1 hypothetical protein CBR_g25772 [Chara braunii]